MSDRKKTWQDIDNNVEALETATFKKYDSGKPQLSLVPGSMMAAVARVMAYGATKYGRDNWRKAQDEDTYRLADAALRHMMQWLGGFELVDEDAATEAANIAAPADHDEETGMPHLWHAACCIAFLIDLAYREGWSGYNPWEVDNGNP